MPHGLVKSKYCKIMRDQEMKLYAFQPTNDYGQYSFFVMAENEDEARRAVERYIEETFASTCTLPYAGFGTDSYKLSVLDRGEVIYNAND